VINLLPTGIKSKETCVWILSNSCRFQLNLNSTCRLDRIDVVRHAGSLDELFNFNF
jgi:hypothetical protein